jgi:hypothetical protein
MRRNKIDDALFDCYRELFANSTPVGDFDKLVEEAELNEWGQKVIPFDDYVIAEETCRNIISDTLTKHKVPKRLHQSFNTAIYLGCSPRFTPKK